MKNISKLILGLAVMFSFSACEKDEEKAVLDAKAPSMLTPVNNAAIILKKEDRDKTIEFTWRAATFGFDASATYTLEMAKTGTNFKEPLAVGVVNNLNRLVMVIDDFNNKLLNYLPDPETALPLSVDMRLKATVSPNVDPLYSPVLKLTITPYAAKIIYPLISVPGAHQGWNPADSTTAIASVKSDGKYEGYLWFAAAGNNFKYSTSFSWAVNYGDNSANGNLQRDGANIVAGAAGYYKLNVNINELKHTFVRTEWAVIGSSTPGGWDSEQKMTYNTTTKLWTVTVNLVVGKLKFRANNAWDINLGDDGANGTLEYGGADIDVTTTGSHTITLNLSKPIYRFTVVKN